MPICLCGRFIGHHGQQEEEHEDLGILLHSRQKDPALSRHLQ
jgi:hypothetical protein